MSSTAVQYAGALRRLLLQTLHGGAGLRDQTVVFLLTACAGVLYDLRGLRLRRGELRRMRGLLLLGLGQTPVCLIERVRYLLCAVVQHSGDRPEQEFLHQHEQDQQVNKHPDDLCI